MAQFAHIKKGARVYHAGSFGTVVRRRKVVHPLAGVQNTFVAEVKWDDGGVNAIDPAVLLLETDVRRTMNQTRVTGWQAFLFQAAGAHGLDTEGYETQVCDLECLLVEALSLLSPDQFEQFLRGETAAELIEEYGEQFDHPKEKPRVS